jgi:hypothetical protein
VRWRRGPQGSPWFLSRRFRADRPCAARAVRAGLLTSGRIIPTGRHCRREKPRTGPGGKPQESWRGSREPRLPACAPDPWSAARLASPRPAAGKRRRDRYGKPDLHRAGTALKRRKHP